MLSLSGRLEVELNEGLHIYEEPTSEEMKDIEETIKVLNMFVDMADVLGFNYNDVMNVYYKINPTKILSNLYGDSFIYSKSVEVMDAIRNNAKVKQMRASYIYKARQERAK